MCDRLVATAVIADDVRTRTMDLLFQLITANSRAALLQKPASAPLQAVSHVLLTLALNSVSCV